MKKISVIIPIYNSENYLNESLSSVQRQTYKDLEIILVDDGSTDGSAQIVEKYISGDKRYHLIRQEHQGANVARKIGTIKATSDYVLYVDSDDVLDKEYIEKMVESYSDDLVLDRSWHSKLDGEKECAGSIPEGIYKKGVSLEWFYSHMIVGNGNLFGVWPSLSGKIFKRELLMEVYQEDNSKHIYYGEDRNIIYRYLLKCNTVKVVDIGGYYYIKRENSATTSVHDDYLENVSELYISLKSVFEKHYMSENLLNQLQKMITDMSVNASSIMGFSYEFRVPRYRFNTFRIEKKSKIILYGAGSVGKDFYRQITSEKDIVLIDWIDKNVRSWEEAKIQVHSLDRIMKKDFDYIIIAVLDYNLAQTIKTDLVNMGIEKDKIIWEEPIKMHPFL